MSVRHSRSHSPDAFEHDDCVLHFDYVFLRGAALRLVRISYDLALICVQDNVNHWCNVFGYIGTIFSGTLKNEKID